MTTLDFPRVASTVVGRYRGVKFGPVLRKIYKKTRIYGTKLFVDFVRNTSEKKMITVTLVIYLI